MGRGETNVYRLSSLFSPINMGCRNFFSGIKIFLKHSWYASQNFKCEKYYIQPDCYCTLYNIVLYCGFIYFYIFCAFISQYMERLILYQLLLASLWMVRPNNYFIVAQITTICLKFFGALALMAFIKYFFRNLTSWGYFPPVKMHLAYSMLIKHCWLHFSNKTIKRYYFRPCRNNDIQLSLF